MQNEGTTVRGRVPTTASSTVSNPTKYVSMAQEAPDFDVRGGHVDLVPGEAAAARLLDSALCR
ncbi:hypothetical protein PG991_007239 [Apiospora marii]|uniref:Uncharacterized protein n=1 Tax=Apiospora marii TaxID=335849 RepID=A0ABR1RU28_9PEZI